MPRSIREVPWLDRRNGVFNVCWYEPPTEEQKRRNPQAKGQTKRLGLRTRDPSEAQARYAAFLATGYHKTVNGGQLTVKGAIDHYFTKHLEVKAVDLDRARSAAYRLEKFFGEDTPLASLGVPACNEYAAARRKDNASDSTIRRELVVLQAAAHKARKWGLIAASEVPEFELPAEVDDGQEVRWFTQDELDRLLGAAEGRLRDFIVLAYGWGARRRSVEELDASQVRLDLGRVNLQKAGQQVTKKRRPIVPIFPEQRETLERLVGEAKGGWLFGRGRFNSYHPFRRLCEDCGFEEDRRHPHMLRHSRATHLLMEGVPLSKLATLLGDSLQTVEANYWHPSPDFLAI